MPSRYIKDIFTGEYRWVDYESAPSPQPKPREPSAGPYFVPDIAPFIAPGYVPISSRSQLRAYEQRTGTRQVGTDLKAEDYGKSEPKINERAIAEAAGKAIQRVLGS